MSRALLVAVLVLAGCATPPEQDSDWIVQRELRATDFEFPTSAADYRLQGVEELVERHRGFTLAYYSETHPGFEAAVYIDPVANSDGGSLAWVVGNVDQRLQTAIQEQIDARGETGTGLERRVAVLGEGILSEGLLSLQRFERGPTKRELATFAAANHDWTLGVLAHWPAKEGADHSPFEDFVDAIVPGIEATFDSETPEMGTTVFANVFLFRREGDDCAIAAYILYGVELSEAIAEGRYTDTFDRELRVRTRMVDYWDDAVAEKGLLADGGKCGSPVLEAMSAAREKGFLEEYVWDELRTPYWNRPAGLRLDEYIEWFDHEFPEHSDAKWPGVSVRWADGSDAGKQQQVEAP